MVLPEVKAFIARHWHPERGSWVQLAQVFIGLFFMGAGAWKFYNYFLTGDQLFYNHMAFWLDKGWPPDWYEPFMRNIAQMHDHTFAVLVMLMQFIPGLMIMANVKARWAGFILLLLQINVFLGVFGHTNFNEFVGLSLWMALFYALKPADPREMSPRVWLFLKVLFVVFAGLLAYNRWNYDDPWMRGYLYQRDQLAQDVVSSFIYIKLFVLWLTQFTWFGYVWVSKWWLRVVFTGLLLTRWAAFAGAALLVMQTTSVMVWLNGTTSQGVLWVVGFFTFVTMEQFMRMLDKKDPSRRVRIPWKKLFATVSARLRPAS